MPIQPTRVHSTVSSLLLKSIWLHTSINLMQTLYALLLRTFALGHFYGCFKVAVQPWVVRAHRYYVVSTL